MWLKAIKPGKLAMSIIVQITFFFAILAVTGCAQVAPGQCSAAITPEKQAIARDVIKDAKARASDAPFSGFEGNVQSRYEDCGTTVRVFFDPREDLDVGLTDWGSELFIIDIKPREILRYKEDY